MPRTVVPTLWLLATAATLFLAVLPVDLTAQGILAGGLLGVLSLLRPWRHRALGTGVLTHAPRVIFVLLTLFVSLRYFGWRTLYTLDADDLLSQAGALILYGAELYAFAIMALGAFVNLHPLRRGPTALPEDPERWPTVDVLIPSYNEDPALLEVTLLGALNMRYPAHKRRIWLLDDGGTRQKCEQADPEAAAAARRRQRTLKALCRRLGVEYRARERNEHAKAGNINAALPHCHNELVLILDADHVPTVDFLEYTVGGFIEDPQLFLVQTPHFFVSPDPIEKNLETYQRAPSENEMFYTVIQRGLDFWEGSFFCGSAALLRRRHLDEIGGLCGESITEDAETALALHARGYRSVYLHRPLVAALQPETLVELVKQRMRWAQGMLQILLLKNPLRMTGLRPWQRAAYLNSMLFWLFPFARMVFLLAPSAYLLLGLSIYQVNLVEFAAYGLPHLVAMIWLADFLYGRVRWAFVSELYELTLSLFLIRPLLAVLRRPRSPSFKVTLKGETLDHTALSPLTRPFYLMLAIILATLAAGVYRWIEYPALRDQVLITMAWEAFNLLLMLGALGALLEQRQRRSTPRIPVDTDATLVLEGGQLLHCKVHDLSVGGAGITVDARSADMLANTPPRRLVVADRAVRKLHSLPVTLPGQPASGNRPIGLRFVPTDAVEQAAVVSLVYGDSERWRQQLMSRNRSVGVRQAVTVLLGLALNHAWQHLLLLLNTALESVSRHKAATEALPGHHEPRHEPMVELDFAGRPDRSARGSGG